MLVVFLHRAEAIDKPRSIELNQNILLGIHDNVLVAVRDNDSDGTFLRLGNGLGLDAGLKFARNKVIDKLADLRIGDCLALVQWELQVLDSVLDGERGPLADLEVQVLSVLTKCRGVDCRDVDNALVLLSDGLEILGELRALGRGFGEDVCKRDAGLGTQLELRYILRSGHTYSHVVGVSLWADLSNQRGCGSLGELLDRFDREGLVENILTLVKRLVEDNAGLCDTLGLCQSSVTSSAKQVGVAKRVGNGGKRCV